MKCSHVKVGKVSAIICGRDRIQTCECGKIADLLCDWKIEQRPGHTCDEPICDNCTTKPSKGKDLCKGHAALWDVHPNNRQRELAL